MSASTLLILLIFTYYAIIPLRHNLILQFIGKVFLSFLVKTYALLSIPLGMNCVAIESELRFSVRGFGFAPFLFIWIGRVNNMEYIFYCILVLSSLYSTWIWDIRNENQAKIIGLIIGQIYTLCVKIAFLIFSVAMQGACPSCGKKTTNMPGRQVT